MPSGQLSHFCSESLGECAACLCTICVCYAWMDVLGSRHKGLVLLSYLIFVKNLYASTLVRGFFSPESHTCDQMGESTATAVEPEPG